MSKVRRPKSPTRKLAAKAVREARAALGWSRERAEHESGISARSIGSMERGEVPMLALELVINLRLAAAGQASDGTTKASLGAQHRGDQETLDGQRVSSKPTGAQRVDGPGPRAVGESNGPESSGEARSRDLLGRAANSLGATATQNRSQKTDEALAAARTSDQHTDDAAARTVASSVAGARKAAA